MASGRLITLEGGEGAGKSTQMTTLATLLGQQGFDVLPTREPGGTQLGEGLRGLLLHRQDLDISPASELLMMMAARVQHWQQVIAPALARGQWVICDRFKDATVAYQGYGRGLDLALIHQLHQQFLPMAQPHLTLIFDVDCDLGLSRVKGRGKPDRFERSQQDFFARVRQGYQQLAQQGPPYQLIDGNQPLEQVTKQVRYCIERFLHQIHGQ